jgi:hypothetical protein
MTTFGRFPIPRLCELASPSTEKKDLPIFTYFAASATAGCADFSFASFDDACAFVE